MTTREELESFHRFAVERLTQGQSSARLDELFLEWHDRQSADEIHRAIRQGLADIDAGRVRPAGEVMNEIRCDLGLSEP